MKEINLNLSIGEVFDLVRLSGALQNNEDLFTDVIHDLATRAQEGVEELLDDDDDYGDSVVESSSDYDDDSPPWDDDPSEAEDLPSVTPDDLSHLTRVKATVEVSSLLHKGDTYKVYFGGDGALICENDDDNHYEELYVDTLVRSAKTLRVLDVYGDEHEFSVNKWPTSSPSWASLLPCDVTMKVVDSDDSDY